MNSINQKLISGVVFTMLLVFVVNAFANADAKAPALMLEFARRQEHLDRIQQAKTERENKEVIEAQTQAAVNFNKARKAYVAYVLNSILPKEDSVRASEISQVTDLGRYLVLTRQNRLCEVIHEINFASVRGSLPMFAIASCVTASYEVNSTTVMDEYGSESAFVKEWLSKF